MAENITQETDADAESFLDTIEHEGRRDDARVLLALMRRVTGVAPRMWGNSIIGFGRYHYRYDSGREGDFFRVGFSPRKANLAIYLNASSARHAELLNALGKHRTGVSCLYVNRLKDVDLATLEALVRDSWERAREVYGEPA
jgi:hypothetical protein